MPGDLPEFGIGGDAGPELGQQDEPTNLAYLQPPTVHKPPRSLWGNPVQPLRPHNRSVEVRLGFGTLMDCEGDECTEGDEEQPEKTEKPGRDKEQPKTIKREWLSCCWQSPNCPLTLSLSLSLSLFSFLSPLTFPPSELPKLRPFVSRIGSRWVLAECYCSG